MISALHSVVVRVRDLTVAVHDYALLLGHDPVRIESNSARGTRSAFFALANGVFELCSDCAPTTADRRGESGEGTFGQTRIRLVCDDDQPAAALAARNIRVASSEDEEGVADATLGIRRWRSHGIEAQSSRGLPIELISGESTDPLIRENRTPPAIDRSERVHALDHVVIMSPDPDGTRSFYGDGLGIRLALDRSFVERGVRLLFFRLGGVTIEIGSRLGVEAQPERSDRFGGLAWQVVDVEAIRARLLGDGFDVSEIRRGNKPGTRVCTVRDPVHGVPTLLIEPDSSGK